MYGSRRTQHRSNAPPRCIPRRVATPAATQGNSLAPEVWRSHQPLLECFLQQRHSMSVQLSWESGRSERAGQGVGLSFRVEMQGQQRLCKGRVEK
jgi:hypothetical protein